MRNLIVSLLTILALSSCNQAADSFTIDLQMEGIEGKWILLNSRVKREFIAVDSALIEAGKPAVLSGSVDAVEPMYLVLKGERKSVRLLMENAGYTVSGTMEEPLIESTGQAQKDLNSYNDLVAGFEKKLSAIVQAYYAALDNQDQAAADSIITDHERVRKEKTAMDSLYVAENPGSYASVLVLRNTFYSLDTNDLEKVLTSLDPSVRQMEEYKYMFSIMEKQKAVAVGKKYIDFGLETPEGEMLKVSEVHQGKVLLIDFWASWCGPCRRANPELVALYADYQEKGFEILGVSLDNDRASWLKAIEEDQLTWHHISDVQGWESEGSKLYGVPAIPHAVLIDREGLIIAKNLHGAALREAIESLL